MGGSLEPCNLQRSFRRWNRHELSAGRDPIDYRRPELKGDALAADFGDRPSSSLRTGVEARTRPRPAPPCPIRLPAPGFRLRLSSHPPVSASRHHLPKLSATRYAVT